MKALIIANSPEFDTSYLQSRAGDFDLLVVLDGAVEKLPPTVTPHIVCGDFDSVDIEFVKERYPSTEVVCLPDQHENDFEKGLRLTLARGAREVVVACALGGKLQETLANTAVMIRHHQACSLSMIYRLKTFRVLSDRPGAQSAAQVAVKKGSEFACIAVENEAVVTIRNVAWELHEQVLHPGSHGVGNTTTSEMVSVSVHRGLVVLSFEEVFGKP